MSNLGNKEIMAKNIRYYMDKYDKTRQEMCDARLQTMQTALCLLLPYPTGRSINYDYESKYHHY